MLDFVLWSKEGYVFTDYGTPILDAFSKSLWHDFFKKPIDTRPHLIGGLYNNYRNAENILLKIREFFFSSKWYQIYDFLEFTVRFHSKDPNYGILPKELNDVLERELSGFRIISGTVVEITNDNEIQMLDEVLHEKDPKLSGVTQHLKVALELLVNREKPDYRNSIKKSISAVESMVNVMTEKTWPSLSAGLDYLKTKQLKGFHPALIDGWKKIYGYTSDERGIRHALSEENSNVGFPEALYFLLSCTSFTNYLKSKMK